MAAWKQDTVIGLASSKQRGNNCVHVFIEEGHTYLQPKMSLEIYFTHFKFGYTCNRILVTHMTKQLELGKVGKIPTSALAS